MVCFPIDKIWQLSFLIMAGGYYGSFLMEIGFSKFLLNQFNGIKQKLF